MKKVNIKKVNLLNTFKLNRFERPFIFLFTLIFFVIVNLIISSVSLRLDLSNGKAYTLAPATKKIIKNLDDIVSIKFYVSSDLPAKLSPLKTEVGNLLNEFKKENKKIIIINIFLCRSFLVIGQKTCLNTMAK